MRPWSIVPCTIVLAVTSSLITSVAADSSSWAPPSHVAGTNAERKRSTIGSSRGSFVPQGWGNLSSLTLPPRPSPGKDQCPPCFNCLLPAFTCGQFGECNQYDGQCKCPEGWGGVDCLTPLCGSLADGGERFPRPVGEQCECRPGWGGINCNVCQNDGACASFRPRWEQGEDDDEVAGGLANMTCYQGGLAIVENHQVCDVTNRKIIDTIPNQKKPQVTFSCTRDGPRSNASSSLPSYTHPLLSTFASGGGLELDSTTQTIGEEDATGTCSFQFWVDRIESFYCKLDQCSWEGRDGYETNKTVYACKTIECACVPGRFLCGEDGSVNIDDFLVEEVVGPASFQCETGKGCSFEEPAMNNLINDIFGDKSITLNCESGECMHYTSVPGYVRPAPSKTSNVWVALSAALAAVVVLVAFLVFWYLGRSRKSSEGFGGIKLPEDEAAKLMSDHVPATLHFESLAYAVKGKGILTDITGSVAPGQVMAIMGSSGAGKTTFLDILAKKDKRGYVSGHLHINGRPMDDPEMYKRVIGFVDQEDTLMSTLTVYETIYHSAVLRLPRDMSNEAKQFRTLETMNELGILGIKDARIGESGKRSISGGEKRRVSIACELVTSPSILFLDEPTSGLDSYNAFNVIDSLVTLAKNYNRTVVFTIHQPQSNIVALFDRLLLLSKGRMVYSGDFKRCQEHFDALGYPCPSGYNIADYLIDLTAQAAGDNRARQPKSLPVLSPGLDHHTTDLENGFTTRPPQNDGNEAEEDASSDIEERAVSLYNKLRNRTINAYDKLTGSGEPTQIYVPPLPEKLAELVERFKACDQAKITEAEIHRMHEGLAIDGTQDIASDLPLLRGYKKASWWTQFKQLSGRAFKNLYRNPLLLAAHYIVAIVVAFVCGFFFYKVTNDIPGFQNRLGLFLFILSLFGFSCLTSLGVFANERLLFMRERANGYYSPFIYFISKVLFDLLPLRVIPPFILGSIVYGLAGLNPEVESFWKFILTLVLFNLASASIVLFLSVAVSDMGVATLLGNLVMLYNLLFAGLLMNYDRVPKGFQWMQTTSFFHAGYEALLVNELRYLQLVEHKFGLDIQVPSATILSSFGFHAQAFWYPDISLLAVVFGVFILLSYLALQFLVKEKR